MYHRVMVTEQTKYVILAVRSRQGTVHRMSRVERDRPFKVGQHCYNVECNQRLGGTIVGVADLADNDAAAKVKAMITCERCNPALRQGGTQ